MRIIGLPKNVYKLSSYTQTQENLEKQKAPYAEKVKLWEKIKNGTNDLSLCSEVTGISKATYYRYKKILKTIDKGIPLPSKRPQKLNKPTWGESERQRVLQIRRENPTYGKAKIAAVLRRNEGEKVLSVSMVGRILTHLKSGGLITRSSSAIRAKNRRKFKKHAQPAPFVKYEDIKLGERIQIDHMTVSINGIRIKHFEAWDRRSKFVYASVYSNANAKSARRFLKELISKIPFPIISIQVDGGSEFMAEFEDECADLKIPLYVLPPRSPQLNGGVERANRSLREEFYTKNRLEDSVRAIEAELKKYIIKFNNYRPHAALNYKTPMEYINSIDDTALKKSQTA